MAAQDGESQILFLVGARRTGSSLLHNLLCRSVDTHPYAGEFQLLTHLLNAFDWGNQNYHRLVRFYFRSHEVFTRFETKTVLSLVDEALLTLNHPRCAIFKNPELSKHALRLAEIFPNAKFLVTMRDPRDQAASERSVISRREPKGESSRSRPARALAVSFCSNYEPLWKLQEREPERIFFVRYEDLVLHPEETIAGVCAFIGISSEGIQPHSEWNFGEVDSAAMQARPSWTELFGKPLNAGRIGSFTTVFGPSEIREIDEETLFIRRRFQYATDA